MAHLSSPTIALQRYDTLEASDVHDFHQIVLGIDGAMVMAVDGVSQRLDRIGALLGEGWRDPERALEHQLALRLHRLRR